VLSRRYLDGHTEINLSDVQSGFSDPTLTVKLQRYS
jgi:hypothetical protein